MLMDKKNILNFRLLAFEILLICILTNLSFSQQFPIQVTLHQPPPGQLNLHHLWRTTLNNTSDKEIKIYLEGYAEEETDGRLVEGQTKLFTIKGKEKKDYQYEDFKTGSVNWFPKKVDYKEIITKTGTAPEGTYTICILAKNESGDIVGMENCIIQPIILTANSEIILVSPDNDATIEDPSPLFIWSPPMPAPKTHDNYDLKIVELQKGQSLEDAIKRNTVFFEEKGIIATQYKYAAKGPLLKKDVKYAWVVKAGEILSGVWSFTITVQDSNPTPQKETNLISVLKYYYELRNEPSNNYLEISKDTLNIQFYNNYASTDKIITNIYDVESNALIKPRVNADSKMKNINGLNRIHINLKNYYLQPGRKYQIKVSDYKSNYYLNFKLAKAYGK
jgi:hypothetical protein